MSKFHLGFVAFIDIYGWSAMVRQATKDTGCFNRLAKLLEAIQRISDAVTSKNSMGGVHIRQFSDSIFLVVDIDEAFRWAETTALHCMWIARECLKRGILCRGGVTIGEYFIDDKVVFGPALERAYQIEKSVKIPIIAIDPCPKILNQFMDEEQYGAHAQKKDSTGQYYSVPISMSPLAKTSSGTIFIDYLRADVASEPEFGPNAVFTNEEKESAIEGILKTEYPLSARATIDWFRVYQSDVWRSEKKNGIEQLNFVNNRELVGRAIDRSTFELYRFQILKDELPPI